MKVKTGTWSVSDLVDVALENMRVVEIQCKTKIFGRKLAAAVRWYVNCNKKSVFLKVCCENSTKFCTASIDSILLIRSDSRYQLWDLICSTQCREGP